MTPETREELARAMAGEEVWTGNNSLYPAMRDNWRARVTTIAPIIERLVAERDALREALDALALALADKGHTWTPEQRALYESATEGKRPC